MPVKRDFFIDALHIFVLSGFAFAQPLFDLLSRNAEFFIARQSEPIDVIFLVVILSFLLPVFFVLIEALSGIFGRLVRKWVHGAIVVFLVALILLPALKKLGDVPSAVTVGGALLVGLAFTAAYVRFRPVRTFLTVLTPTVLLIPALFLFNSSISRIISTGNAAPAVYNKVESKNPVILIVFDEFPVTSLLDENSEIDPIRYPNFAALTKDAYWFRHAATVAPSTLRSIPAILSGSYPKDTRFPTAADYPHSLFTLLGGSYEMKVLESDTMLCPESLCRDETNSPDMESRIRYLYFTLKDFTFMLRDLSAVYLNIIFPSDLTGDVPIVTQTWKNFWNSTSENRFSAQAKHAMRSQGNLEFKDRTVIFKEFLESIAVSEKPALYFIHMELPHVPWEYFPSGKSYTNEGMRVPGRGYTSKKWSDVDWLVTQGYQRHLLQVGFADKLVGDLTARLKELHLYDSSLIIITADHGINFWPDKAVRLVLKDHPMDTLGIPLIIKAPNQKKGEIIDTKIRTIDILPTVAGMLNIELPWPVDGKPVFDPSFIGHDHPDNHETLARKLELFGSGATRPAGLTAIGPHKNLIGRPVSEIETEADDDVAVELDQQFNNVDPEGGFIPAQVTGRIKPDNLVKAPLDLAVAVNGKIQAMTRTFEDRGSMAEFTALVPESAFNKGANEVEVLIVSDQQGKLRLKQAKNLSRARYELVESKTKGEVLIRSDGTAIPVVPNELAGELRLIHIMKHSTQVRLSGWAADAKRSALPKALLIFVDGKFLYSRRCNWNRPDVARHFKDAALTKAGFEYFVPLSLIKDINDFEVRIFALSSEGVASELQHTRKLQLKPALKETKSLTGVDYQLIQSTGKKAIITCSDGRSIPVIPGKLIGHLDRADVLNEYLFLFGWAADVKKMALPEAVLIFADGKYLFSQHCNNRRPDVARHFNADALEKAGFRYTIPVSMVKDINNCDIRIFALSAEGAASELIYPKGYKWKKS